MILMGYSGHGLVVADTAVSQGRPIEGYCEAIPKLHNPHQLAYLGTEEELYANGSSTPYFIGVGNNTARKRIDSKLQVIAEAAPALQHPQSFVSPLARFQALSLVCLGAKVQVDVTVERGVIINTGASVDHESVLEASTHIAPGATLAGNVHVEEGALIGVGAVVLPGLRIGAWATLGAGSVLTINLPAGEIWAGNPARRIK